MAKPGVKNVKAAAKSAVPQTHEEATNAIAAIGRAQRERTRIEAAMNDELAVIRQKYELQALPLEEEIERLSEGVQTWCEANRQDLTNNGKTKTAQLASGEVRWRTTPPSVSLKSVEKVIETLRSLGLTKFLREKTEVNKEAILAEPDEVKGLKGIKINQSEEFVIVPFETKLEEVA